MKQDSFPKTFSDTGKSLANWTLNRDKLSYRRKTARCFMLL